MKRRIILLILIAFIFSCQQTPLPANDKYTRNMDASMLTGWINLQLRLARSTTGLAQVAYSRHFAYTGVALYESLVHGDPAYNSVARELNSASPMPVPPDRKIILWPAAANAAVAEMLRYFYAAVPSNLALVDSMEQVNAARFTKESGCNHTGSDMAASIAFGKQVAAAVISWSEMDNAGNASTPYYLAGEGRSLSETAPLASLAVPGWGNNRTIVPGSTLGTSPTASFTADPGSSFYIMINEGVDMSFSPVTATRELTKLPDEGLNGNYLNVFTYWFDILGQVLSNNSTSLIKGAEAWLRLGISMNDAAISCWKTRYSNSQLRPQDYFRNDIGLKNWNRVLITPMQPETSAARATVSAAAAKSLAWVFGRDYCFTDHSFDEIGAEPRHFKSFEEAAGLEPGISRFSGENRSYASIPVGFVQGKRVAEYVNRALRTREQ